MKDPVKVLGAAFIWLETWLMVILEEAVETTFVDDMVDFGFGDTLLGNDGRAAVPASSRSARWRAHSKQILSETTIPPEGLFPSDGTKVCSCCAIVLHNKRRS